MDTSRIEHIHQQLAEIRRRAIEAFGAETHGFQLNPPLAPDALEDFEAKHDIRLPEEYREFLLRVGNGGAGQAYGLYPLDKTDTGGVLNHPSPLHPEMPQEGDWYDVLGLDEDSEAVYDGAVTLLTQGCTYDVLLLVSGPHRGRIVYVDWNMMYAPYFSQFPDFLTWYETWLSETLAGYDMTWFGHGLPLNTPETLAVAVNSHEPLVQRKAALNNLLRTPTLSAEQLRPLKVALLAEKDRECATSMLCLLAEHGETDLSEISWSLLKKAQGQQLFWVVKAMQTANLPNWTDAALWVLEQDTDQDASQSILFLLQREQALSRQAIELAFASKHVVSTGLYVNSEFSDPLPIPDHFFTHPDAGARRYSAEYQPDESLHPKLGLLIKLFPHEESDFVRQGWALKLGHSKEPVVTAALTEFLQRESSPKVRSALIRQLGEHKALQAVPALIELTRGDDTVLRLEAAKALGEIGDLRAQAALEALLDQHEQPFRAEDGGGVGYAYSVADAARQALEALKGQSIKDQSISAKIFGKLKNLSRKP